MDETEGLVQAQLRMIPLVERDDDSGLPSENLFRHAPPFSMYVHVQNDIVSQQVLQTGSWDGHKVRTLIEALASVQRQREEPNPQNVYFLDVGANIGVFTYAAAVAGYPTLSFEPMSQNQRALQKTACSESTDKSIAESVTLFPVGLGGDTMRCSVVSDTINQGDGHMRCESTNNSSFSADYHSRDTDVNVVRLDDQVAEWRNKIGVAKIDVEGFEAYVLKGGEQTLLRSKIPYIVSEVEFSFFNTFMIVCKKHRLYIYFRFRSAIP
jgi:FkbM family methyltransferase